MPLYETIRSRVLADFGRDYDFVSNMRMQGLLNSEVAQMMVEEYQLPISAEEFGLRSSRVAAEVFTNSQLMPGWFQVPVLFLLHCFVSSFQRANDSLLHD